MDVKFLEGYGIKLSGKVIDTLELVQFILPTHHSYNLENLVHYFGIKHHKAHRALGDAVSTISVLESLICLYQQFTDHLKSELEPLLKKGKFSWSELLGTKISGKRLQNNDSLQHTSTTKKLTALQLKDSLITIDGNPNDHEARIAAGLMMQPNQAVLAVDNTGTVMRLWREGYVHGVFQSEDTFSKSAFEQFMNSAQTLEELRFCLKIIVWLHTNWQTEVVYDLNISFFGGQFRQFIVGGKPVVKNEKVVAVDYSTLQAFQSSGTSPLKNRELVVADIQSFEKFMSSGFGTRLSWSSVIYGLRLVYNPETDFGDHASKDKVLSALTSTDLFFGLTYMLIHSAIPNRHYATVEELENNHQHIYSRITRAAENLKVKLREVLDHSESKEIQRCLDYLETFFQTSQGHVKWINIDEKNLSFSDQPIDISAVVKRLLKSFTKVRFTDLISSRVLLSYLVDRLGLDTEESDLSSKFTENCWPKQLSLSVESELLEGAGLREIIKKSKLPTVVVMPQLMDIKDFYNQHYSDIKKTASLFAQGYSGGGNKMFRNFSINPKSILLVTADFMAKQSYLIPAKTIIFTAIPGIEQDHPYTAALLNHWQTRHPDLISVLAYAKVIAALKKIKISEKVAVSVFGVKENKFLVDKSR